MHLFYLYKVPCIITKEASKVAPHYTTTNEEQTPQPDQENVLTLKECSQKTKTRAVSLQNKNQQKKKALHGKPTHQVIL